MPGARVGNDVVDLGDPAITGAPPSARWIHRVCDDPERERIATATDPTTLLWTMFAAKEAAYKVVAKLGPRPVFAHRRFVVAADLRSVRYEGIVLWLSLHRAGERLHAVASTVPEAPLWAAGEFVAGEAPGRGARRLLCRTVASRIGCDPDQLRVVRDPLPGSWDGFAPPRLERQGAPLDLDVSLSHDGRYVAFAAALPFLGAGEGATASAAFCSSTTR